MKIGDLKNKLNGQTNRDKIDKEFRSDSDTLLKEDKPTNDKLRANAFLAGVNKSTGNENAQNRRKTVRAIFSLA